ncbi:MAG: ABC transporter ATP-binding protein [Pirellulaceae bacterium]|nr:ABC transporter ATP-binding protein [Pirellulaceae bacterium]
MIQIEDLQFDYASGQQAEDAFRLSIPHLTIQAGERVALIGPSGAGKSTLLHLIAGAVQPSRGTIRVASTCVSSLGDAQRRHFRVTQIGFVFQDFQLLEHLSVRENILLPYLIHRGIRADAQVHQRLEQLAADAGLGAKLARSPGRLSHGERQRVAVCRALIAQPSILLADEPTGSLDPQTAAHVLELLLNQVRSRSTTLLLVTHDRSWLGRFDRVIDIAAITCPSAAAEAR